MVRNPSKPGMHAKRRSNVSEFGMQLREKQKIRFSYGVSETQLKNYMAQISKKGASGEALMSKLERRLDNAVYRMGFASSRGIAGQMVGHGHVYLNGKRMDIPSYEVKIGDTAEIRPSSKDSALFKDLKESVKKYTPPTWLKLDKELLKGEVVSMPSKEDLTTTFNTNLVIEFYSR